MTAAMDPRISLVTLIVDDVERSRSFYVDGLRWPSELFVPGEVLMIRVGARQILSLWQRDKAESELGAIARGEGAPPVTLAHNVASRADVDAAVEVARRARATVVAEPVAREWGGYSAYVADPDGFRWEISHNPGVLGDSLLP